MQTIVLIGIYADLLIKRNIPRKKLCEKYELSARTISRYIDELSKAGVPIESRAGIGGGYILPDDYKVDRLLFTEDERRRIADSLRQTSGLYGDAVTAQILEKLGVSGA